MSPDRPTSTVPPLDLNDVDVTYNNVALGIRGVSMHVPPGAIVAILGANGAGKTTTLRAITGVIAADGMEVTHGTLDYGGTDIRGWPPHKLARAGIVLIPERDKIFPTLTVEANIRSVAAPKGRGDHAATLRLVDDLFPVLGQRRKQLAGYLSGGERQMLAIAMSLMLEPTLLLADELSQGVAPVLTERIMAAIKRINEEMGTSIVLVEQNAVLVNAVADYAYVLQTGSVVAEGSPSVLMSDDRLREFYLGSSGAEPVVAEVTEVAGVGGADADRREGGDAGARPD